jgi:exonuclease SbcD
MIAGNHDSPGRLGFGARVLRRQGLYVRAWPQADPDPIAVRDAHGPVHVLALPFAEPSLVRERVSADAVREQDAGLRALLRSARAAVPRGERAVLMAHAFVAGGQPSESERPLTVGGAGQVGVGRFRGFDYVALGHLHRPQRMGSDRVWYSGSLLKYSFEEARQGKSVNVVEIDGRGACRVECVPLSPRRDVRCMRGRLREILERRHEGASRDDYLRVTLEDPEPVFDALGKLREVYPNVLELERPFLSAQPDPGSLGDHRRLDEAVLFERFFAEVTGLELSPEHRRVFAGAVAALRESEREAAP